MDDERRDRDDGETPASHGDPSRSGALGSDTGKVEVTGSEDDDGGQPGPTALGHTYEGAGMGIGGDGTETPGASVSGGTGLIGAEGSADPSA